MKRRWIAPLLLGLLAAVVFGCTKETAEAVKPKWDFDNPVQATSGAFTCHAYKSGDNKECWIYRIDVDPDAGDTSELEIPSQIEEVPVTHIGYTDAAGNADTVYNLFGNVVDRETDTDGYGKELKGIRTVRIPDTVTDIEEACFSGLRYLTKVDIPDSVHRLRIETFYGCRRLRSIVLPENMIEFHANAFADCVRLKKISISEENELYEVVDHSMLITKKEQEFLFVVAGKSKVDIPDGVTSIVSGAFSLSRAKRVTIPATVTSIGKRALENEHIKDIRIDNGNNIFAISGQCIYTKEDERLIAVMPGDNGYLRISNRIRKIDDMFSIAGGEVKVVILSRNLEEVSGAGLDFDRNGSLKRIYFTGAETPELSDVPKEGSPLPTVEIYVPRNAEDDYEDWYKKYDCYDDVQKWDTYNQSHLSKVEDKANE